MVQEITNFVETLPQEIFAKYLKPKEGLYIQLDIDDEGNLLNKDENGSIKKEDIGKYSEKDEKENGLSEHLLKCKEFFLSSQVMFNSPNKSFNSSSKLFVSVATPFGIGFTKKNYVNQDRDRTKNLSMNKLRLILNQLRLI